eukprot:12025693-Karenia_brevis.AAC.1
MEDMLSIVSAWGRGGLAPRVLKDRRTSKRSAKIWQPDAQMVRLQETDWEPGPQGLISLGHALMAAGIEEG